MGKQRLDETLVQKGLITTRSQAGSYIKLGKVKVNNKIETKAGFAVFLSDKIEVEGEQYVSRAAFKLASAAEKFKLDFTGKIILDVGSSTGGFTDFALKHGAIKVIAVDVGTNQLHPSLQTNKQIELHEKTDIRDVFLAGKKTSEVSSQKPGNRAQQPETRKQGTAAFINEVPDVILIDVSFISLRKVLPAISRLLLSPNSQVLAMVKPQFEADNKFKHHGIVKNDTMRRNILKDFEFWVKDQFVIIDKADSDVSGEKGNLERFYLLNKIKH